MSFFGKFKTGAVSHKVFRSCVALQWSTSSLQRHEHLNRTR